MKEIQADYEAAVRNAATSSPYAMDFERLFPGRGNFISYYSGGIGPSTFNMERLLFDRYKFSMHIPVTIDGSRRKVKSFGEPEFVLIEVTSVTQIVKQGAWPDGSPSTATNLSMQVEQPVPNFHAGEWMKIVVANGDFSALGITLLKNFPAPGFEYLRKDWEMKWGKQ